MNDDATAVMDPPAPHDQAHPPQATDDGPASLGHTLVIGGGVAGIAAATAVAMAGGRVSLVEMRPRLGGRAGSMDDPEVGGLLDNCQHVLLRTCTNLIDLYKRLQVFSRVQWQHELYFSLGQGQIDSLAADDLPAPLHLMRSLIRFKGMTTREKFAVTRGMLSVIQISARGRALHHDETFLDWLKYHRQPERVIKRFWEVIVVSACNERIDRVAASYALQVLQKAFMHTDLAYEMGLANIPLSELYGRCTQFIEAAGGTVHMPAQVKSIEFDAENRQVTGATLKDGTVIEADHVVTAVPWDRLAELADQDLQQADARFEDLDQLEANPIVGIHMFFRQAEGVDRPVMIRPHLVLVDSPLHWIFNKGHNEALNATHLHGVISAAYDLVDQPAGDIAKMVEAETRRFLSGAQDAELVHIRVIKEKAATFSPRPGVDRIRPKTTGRVSNLYFAGDWTATGWPATMEGACRSGYLAAEAIFAQAGLAQPVLCEDLEPAMLYRVLSG